ncbi:MAG TPA: PA14 domain-containing protein [Tepidisphaeraceae bacterium]|nr:PA14 domain-containing protein [Tepidisphaeraceae bacterium]
MRKQSALFCAMAVAALTPLASAASGVFQVNSAVLSRTSGHSIASVSDANNLLSGAWPASVTNQTTAQVINYYDPQSANVWLSHFPYTKVPFPTDTAGVDNFFALRATGTLVIPTTGAYTFGVNSDDGFDLKVGSTDLMSAGNRNASDSLKTITLAAGNYPIDLTYYQSLGQSEVELWAGPGTWSTFNAAPAGTFRLIGDTSTPKALQLAATAVPEPATATVGLVSAALLLVRRRRAM